MAPVTGSRTILAQAPLGSSSLYCGFEPSWLKHAFITNCELSTSIRLVILILYQSTVVVIRCARGCSNGELSTTPAVQVSPCSLFRFRSPWKVTTAGGPGAKLFAPTLFHCDALLPPSRL